jgi:hypothetical protein
MPKLEEGNNLWIRATMPMLISFEKSAARHRPES